MARVEPMRSPLCSCGDRSAIHIRGTGPCLRRGCHCPRFTEDGDGRDDPGARGEPAAGGGGVDDDGLYQLSRDVAKGFPNLDHEAVHGMFREELAR